QIELLLATHAVAPGPPTAEVEGTLGALRDLGSAVATGEPVVLKQKLLAAGAALDVLAEKSAETRRGALRQGVSRSSAAVQEALPDALAERFRLREARDLALGCAAAAAPVKSAVGLASIDASLQDLLATINRVGPALRVPPPEPVARPSQPAGT